MSSIQVKLSNAKAVTFTANAANKAREIVAEKGNSRLKLRVSVSGGGCSGFQYGFSFDENEAADDLKIETNGTVLLVDPQSFPYLVGAVVDYTESLAGSQFVVQNPNATATCGCGASFSM